MFLKCRNELKDKSEVRTFLGLTGYYRSLIKGYANVAAPLSDLLHDDKEWTWEDKEKAAFSKLKKRIPASVRQGRKYYKNNEVSTKEFNPGGINFTSNGSLIVTPYSF